MFGTVRIAADHDALEAIFAFEPGEIPGKRDCRENLPAFLVGDQVAPVLAAGRRCGSDHDLEIISAVCVGADQESIAPVAHAVLDIELAGSDQYRRVCGLRSVDQPAFGRVLVGGRDRNEPLRGCQTDRDFEAEVLFFVNQRIIFRVRTEPMTIHEARTMLGIEPHVEQRRAVRRPGEGRDLRDVEW